MTVVAPFQLILAAILGLTVLLILIIRFKVQAVISILIGAIVIGLVAGMPAQDIINSVNEGVGTTLKNIALLVGIGSMFGAILEVSGGAQVLAVSLLKRFGERRAALALALTGLVVSIPVFFDAGLIILIPLAFSLSKTTGKSTLFYVIPLLAGLAVGHSFIPPTPGPVLVASMLGVDLGWVILVGFICGIPALIIAGPIWGRFCGKKFDIKLPSHIAQMPDVDSSKLPGFATVISIILIPLLLIMLKSLSGVLSLPESVTSVLLFLGEPFVALTITTVAAMLILGLKNGYKFQELEKVMTKSLEPVGLILLVTAAGGILRYVLQNSGLGEIIGNAISVSALPLVLVAFLLAALVRISIGSATVSMTMAAGIISSVPELAGLSAMYLACTVAAIAAGATVCSHFNDSGFWLVKSLVGMDEKTTLKTWTLMETLTGVVGFAFALILSFFA